MKQAIVEYPIRFLFFGIVLVLVGAGLWYAARPPQTLQTQTVPVARGVVRSFVDVTGRAEPEDRLALSFPASGIIDTVFVTEGASIGEGARVASLDTTSLSARMREQQAGVARERAALNALRAGTRSEDVAITRGAKEKTAAALVHSEADLLGIIERGYVLADSLLRNNADALFENATTPNPDFGITLSYGGASYTLQTDVDAEVALTIARRKIGEHAPLWRALTVESALSLEEKSARALLYLSEMQDFFTQIAEALADYTDGSANAQTAFASYVSSVSTARTTLSSLLSETRTAREAWSAASAADTVAMRELARAEAGATQEDIAAQEARLTLAEAQRDAAESALRDAILYAPRAGVIAEVNKKAREFIQAGEVIAVLDAGEGVEITAYVPESDIAYLVPGNSAMGTFDAFDRAEQFSFVVQNIASAETMREGVATYKTTLTLAKPDARIKPGMTADLSITVAERPDTLFIPSRAVRQKDGVHFVYVVRGSEKEQREVTIGLRGSEGFTEILSGLTEGEEVDVTSDEK